MKELTNNKLNQGRRFEANRMCTRKMKYRSKKIALDVIVKMKRKGADLTPYQCGWCQFYHIGSKKYRMHTYVLNNIERDLVVEGIDALIMDLADSPDPERMQELQVLRERL